MTMVTAIVVLGGVEISFRALGFQPSVTNDVDLFGLHRDLATREHRVLALVGTSRFQVALDPERMEAKLDGWKVANLSLIGQSALPVLEELAGDPDFRGVVIVEFMPVRIYTADSDDIEEARHYLNRYQERVAYSGLETRLQLWLQSRLVILNPEIRARKIGKAILAGKLPVPHQRFLATRFAPRDYTGQDLEAVHERRARLWPGRVAEALDEDALERRLSAIEQWTTTIQSRGGEVVFFRINSTGPVRELEEEDFPKSIVWDRFVERTNASTIHFDDVPSLREVELPEGSHADFRAAPIITDGLVEALKESGVLEAQSD